jgi:hypothetical protein
MDRGGDEEIESLLFANANEDSSDNSKNEKDKSDDGQEIKVDAIITTNVAEQVGGNHIRHG